MTPRPEITRWGQLVAALDDTVMEHGPKSLKAQLAWRNLRDQTRELVDCSAIRWRLITAPLRKAYAQRWKAKKRGEDVGRDSKYATVCVVALMGFRDEVFNVPDDARSVEESDE